jgi:DNA processing protein
VGDTSLLRRPCVAIVGTREATPYGLRSARALAGALAAAGATVVSGMARGIDAAAHVAALDSRGGTIAVLGAGIDVPYPPSHRRLHQRIAADGLLLSESAPGARPNRGSFPSRNRIIAAISTATIVVEAGHKSGALITARDALDLGRTVAAVPGPIDAPGSAGSNLLVRDGAIVIAAPDDALALVGLSPGTPGADSPRRRATLSAEEASVFDALSRRPLDADAVVDATGLAPGRCAAALSTLELAGLIECAAGGEFRVSG